MESLKTSSPERSKPMKTYSGLSKRKRNSTSYNADQLKSEPEMGDSETRSNQLASGSSKNVAAVAETPVRKVGPKKVDVHLPGPSPQKRVRKESGTNNKATHHRLSSVGHMSPPLSSPRISASGSKPPTPSARSLPAIGSIAKTSPIRFTTPEDDNSSVAESTMGTRVRRTEAERIQLFKDDASCEEVEPYRALCTLCTKWVSLGRQQTYTVRPWQTHRKRCDQKMQRGQQSPSALEEDDRDDAASVAPSVIASELSIRRTETERRALLESDSRAEQVLPNEALCKKCQKWIKLSAKQPYALGNWNSHQQRCSGSTPSSRVASAERKLKLVNDAQVKRFTARNVECAKCGTNVALDSDYAMHNWDAHKANCLDIFLAPRIDLSKVVNIHSAPISKSTGSHRVGGQTRLSPSATSDDTLIASDTSPPIRQPKRAREDDHEVERPINRPRTEKYVAPQQEAPGPWGWFLLPFTALMSGFKEGIQSASNRA